MSRRAVTSTSSFARTTRTARVVAASIALTSALLAAAHLPAQTTQPSNATAATDVTDAELDALIANLSSDDWRERQEAEDRLVLLGAAAEPRLRAAARSAADDEVRWRAEAALGRIAEALVSGPTIVSLNLVDASPRDALDALTREAGVEFAAQPSTLFQRRTGPPITLALDHVPFWEAARRVCLAAGLELRQSNDELRVMSSSGDARMAGPAVVSGPFMIVAQRIVRTHSVQLRAADGGDDGAANAAAPRVGDARATEFTVWFTVYSEPKLRILRGSSGVRLERAVDENGLSLLPPAPPPRGRGGEGDIVNPPPRIWTSSARLDYPDGAGQRIAQLKGAILVTLRTKTDTAEVPDLLNAHDVSGTVAGLPFVLRHFKKLGEREFELLLSVNRDGRPPQEWDRVRRTLAASGVRVLDAEGHPLVRGVPSTNYAADRVDLTIRFTTTDAGPNERTAEPAAMIWEVPTETKDVLVPFEFIDLPIP